MEDASNMICPPPHDLILITALWMHLCVSYHVCYHHQNISWVQGATINPNDCLRQYVLVGDILVSMEVSVGEILLKTPKKCSFV